MARGRRIALIAASAALAVGSLAAAGCGDDDDELGHLGRLGASLSGDILIDGSSTVAPLSSAAAEAFAAENGGVNITVGTSGTGGGFERFCAGETDISDASRAIKDDEIAACETGGVTYQELRVASDGITIVTGADVGRRRRQPHHRPSSTPSGRPTRRSRTGAQIPGGSFNDAAADARRPRLAVGHLRLLQRGGPR